MGLLINIAGCYWFQRKEGIKHNIAAKVIFSNYLCQNFFKTNAIWPELK
jgi:hypothetical protein